MTIDEIGLILPGKYFLVDNPDSLEPLNKPYAGNLFRGS